MALAILVSTIINTETPMTAPQDAWTIKRIAGALGAEVLGIDLSQP